MRIVAVGILVGVLAMTGCSADAGREPDVAVLVPTTEEGYVDDWRTDDWPSAESSDDAAASGGGDSAGGDTGAGDSAAGTTDQTPPETLALADDADPGPWPCESVNAMREVLQWANTTFSEESGGTLEELPDNFRTAVANAQSRDDELLAATASAAASRPELSSDFETLRDRHLWAMSELEQIGKTADDAYDINTAGLDLFESPTGVEWATRVELAKSNVDDQLVPECGVAFDDPIN